MDHHPSWKLHKNPFWRVKHPGGNRLSTVTNTFATPSETGGKVKEPIYAYRADQDVSGKVILNCSKKVEHLGIKVQFIGRIDMSMGIHEGKPHYDFISLSKELSPPGAIGPGEFVIPFVFRNMDKEFESYRGRNVSVRYIIKVLVDRKFLLPLTHEHDVWVQMLGQEPTEHEAIKMEVGIEDCVSAKKRSVWLFRRL
jgi:vacuolar protein sorting-associated protein 26